MNAYVHTYILQEPAVAAEAVRASIPVQNAAHHYGSASMVMLAIAVDVLRMHNTYIYTYIYIHTYIQQEASVAAQEASVAAHAPRALTPSKDAGQLYGSVQVDVVACTYVCVYVHVHACMHACEIV